MVIIIIIMKIRRKKGRREIDKILMRKEKKKLEPVVVVRRNVNSLDRDKKNRRRRRSWARPFIFFSFSRQETLIASADGRYKKRGAQEGGGGGSVSVSISSAGCATITTEELRELCSNQDGDKSGPPSATAASELSAVCPWANRSMRHAN